MHGCKCRSRRCYFGLPVRRVAVQFGGILSIHRESLCIQHAPAGGRIRRAEGGAPAEGMGLAG
jgi:hypothetical protein